MDTEDIYMTIDEYMNFISDYENSADNPKYNKEPILGLFAEVGEAADVINKMDLGVIDGVEGYMRLRMELGDVFFYLCYLLDLYTITPGEVFAHNIEKLKLRYPNGYSIEKQREIERKKKEG